MLLDTKTTEAMSRTRESLHLTKEDACHLKSENAEMLCEVIDIPCHPMESEKDFSGCIVLFGGMISGTSRRKAWLKSVDNCLLPPTANGCPALARAKGDRDKGWRYWPAKIVACKEPYYRS